MKPVGRNGHSTTLAQGKLFVLGGWLGSGPLAADDLHVFDLHAMEWFFPNCNGKSPGPCNMHTADYIESQSKIYVFRGGDGREYLNDLHTLDVDRMEWNEPRIAGQNPSARANHSSAVVGDKLYIFGGWDGQQRLNDIFVFDTNPNVMAWSSPEVEGRLPSPRAGMTFTCVRGNLFLFGGSGPNSRCFNDLQVYSCAHSKWRPVMAAKADSEGEDDQDYASPSSNAYNCHSNKGSNGTHNNSFLDMFQSEEEAEMMEKYVTRQDGSNPNSFDYAEESQVILLGRGPGFRAGHTATLVDHRVFVFGGSHGSEYRDDFYILDADPIPYVHIGKQTSMKMMRDTMGTFLNNKEFSDITFLVDGKVVYGHKVVLSLLSETFRTMFTCGFRESSQAQIPIEMDYNIFMLMMEYLYTGKARKITKLDLWVDDSLDTDSVETVCDLMQAADQFLLDHLKQICESILKNVVNDETVSYLLERAMQCNAQQLIAVCYHLQRNSHGDNAAQEEGVLMSHKK
jgi:hypothetical protein